MPASVPCYVQEAVVVPTLVVAPAPVAAAAAAAVTPPPSAEKLLAYAAAAVAVALQEASVMSAKEKLLTLRSRHCAWVTTRTTAGSACADAAPLQQQRRATFSPRRSPSHPRGTWCTRRPCECGRE